MFQDFRVFQASRRSHGVTDKSVRPQLPKCAGLSMDCPCPETRDCLARSFILRKPVLIQGKSISHILTKRFMHVSKKLPNNTWGPIKPWLFLYTTNC